MRKKIEVAGFRFEFEDVIDAFIFDLEVRDLNEYPDAQLSAVDVLVELKNRYFYIVTRDFADSSVLNEYVSEMNIVDTKNQLTNVIKHKFRDTFLYRFAEQKIDKPIFCLVLSTLPKRANLWLQKNLHEHLPVSIPMRLQANNRWKRPLVRTCLVLDVELWNLEPALNSFVEKI